MTKVVKIIAETTYIGAYGAYWINLGAMIYTMVISLEASGSKLTQTEGIIYMSTYAVLSGIDTTLSFLFVPRIVEWYKTELQIRADIEAREEAKAEAAESAASANGTTDDDDIFVF